MKKIVVFIVFVLFFCVIPAKAYEYRKIADDSRIIEALKVLNTTESYDTLNLVFKKSNKGQYIKIIFYDLGMISYEYKKHYAAASVDELGYDYIIINAKYRNSPKEALAALIAHEVQHQAKKADFDEEVRATLAEVNQWNKSLALNPELKDSINNENDLIKRLNRLSEKYETNGINAINEHISENTFYQTRFVNEN